MSACANCGGRFVPKPWPEAGGMLERVDVCSRRCEEQLAWLHREQAKVTAEARPLPDNVVPIGVARHGR